MMWSIAVVGHNVCMHRVKQVQISSAAGVLLAMYDALRRHHVSEDLTGLKHESSSY